MHQHLHCTVRTPYVTMLVIFLLCMLEHLTTTLWRICLWLKQHKIVKILQSYCENLSCLILMDHSV